MQNKTSVVQFHNTHFLKFLCIGFSLVLFCLTDLAAATPTGTVVYSVYKRDERLGRFDWNLYTTAFGETKDFQGVPLHQKGMYPSWSPDGETLYFIQREAGQSHIYSIELDTPKKKTQVTEVAGTYRFLSVSPDGKKLAFNGWTGHVQQENQIWVLDIATGEMEVMTGVQHFGRTFFFWGLSWSPDSKKIVFSLERPGGLEQLYILDVETKDIEILTELNKDYYPVWSPDGKQILFMRWDREFETFYTIDVETRTLKALFDIDNATGYWTAWSADSQSIIYSWWNTLYLFDVTTEVSTKLLETDGSIFIISWWSGIVEVFPVEPRQKLTTTWGSLKQK